MRSFCQVRRRLDDPEAGRQRRPAAGSDETNTSARARATVARARARRRGGAPPASSTSAVTASRERLRRSARTRRRRARAPPVANQRSGTLDPAARSAASSSGIAAATHRSYERLLAARRQAAAGQLHLDGRPAELDAGQQPGRARSRPRRSHVARDARARWKWSEARGGAGSARARPCPFSGSASRAAGARGCSPVSMTTAQPFAGQSFLCSLETGLRTTWALSSNRPNIGMSAHHRLARRVRSRAPGPCALRHGSRRASTSRGRSRTTSTQEPGGQHRLAVLRRRRRRSARISRLSSRPARRSSALARWARSVCSPPSASRCRRQLLDQPGAERLGQEVEQVAVLGPVAASAARP